MARRPRRQNLLRIYLLYAVLRNFMDPAKSLQETLDDAELDANVMLSIMQTRYLQDRDPVPKAGNLHLAWRYASTSHESRFMRMLRVTPHTFYFILDLISDNPVFVSRSSKPQAPIELQLAVALYRLGRYGNGASVQDIARAAGISEGSVENYTRRCFTAILHHHNEFIRLPTEEEKEVEKRWIEAEVGCPGWREGWLMYDGTIVPLHQKPGLNGDAYFTRKSNYGLNVQIGNMPSRLCIVDYASGLTGSAHDALAFTLTAASKHTDWLFCPGEFAWADSAYPVLPHVIPVFKQPEAFGPMHVQFNKAVAHLRVRSENTNAALKGRFQSLRGLRIPINRKRDHVAACKWISVCIVLHNIAVEVEDVGWTDFYMNQYDEDAEPTDNVQANAEANYSQALESILCLGDGAARRQLLMEELVAYRDAMREGDED